MKRFWLPIMLFSLLVSSACGRQALLRNPEPIHGGASVDATEQAILDALPKHGWSVEQMEPGYVLAFLSVRSHLLRVDIRYDAESVALAYRDSSNLLASRSASGRTYVHKRVNQWMETLAADIRAALAATAEPEVDATAGGEAASEPASGEPAPPLEVIEGSDAP